MSRDLRPPPVATWLLRRALPANGRDDVAGDLEEVFRVRCSRGVGRARLWYWREAVGVSAALLVERLRERLRGRAARRGGGPRRDGLGVSWLDVKLGLRMLAKSPGLTVVGGLGMAVAIALGAGLFAFLQSYLEPAPPPLDDGERIVRIVLWHTPSSGEEEQALHDYVMWRAEAKTIEDLGVYRTLERNLVTEDGRAEPMAVAEMTASGFRLARVAPLLGRPLVEDDEGAGAPAVVVIGYDVWRTRFASDPTVVGRTVRLGATPHTVVGVMPEGFGFPVDHELWVPFRANPLDYARRQGPWAQVFGRLAPGATLESAQAELTMLGRRAAAAYPDTHAQMLPLVLPYTVGFYYEDMHSIERGPMRVTQLVITLLLLVPCVNAAILVYARTAARQGEIAVRTALGASRRRIVGQLFVEALVLAVLAAILGLLIARAGLQHAHAIMDFEYDRSPFWRQRGFSTATIAYVVALTVGAAVVAGVLPAIKATGRAVQGRLRHLGGGTGLRLGGMWTTLIIAQVAFAVAALPMTISWGIDLVQDSASEAQFDADAFLSGRILMDTDVPPTAEVEQYAQEFTSRFATLHVDLVRRLEADPAVAAVTWAARPPGQEGAVAIEIEGAPPPPVAEDGYDARFLAVADDFFQVLDIPLQAGRLFAAGDGEEGRFVAVVNRTFAQRLVPEGDVLGRRIRRVGASGPVGPWHEIVGIVDDLSTNPVNPERNRETFYVAAVPGRVHPVSLAIRTRADPAPFGPRLRAVAAALDPGLRLYDIVPLDRLDSQARAAMRLALLTFGLGTFAVLLLSGAAIHALMSFAVASRRREIGVRAALGARPRRILGSVFSRAAAQLTGGILVGVLLAVPLASYVHDDALPVNVPGLIALVSAGIMLVGLLAAAAPAVRGLRIPPTEALREG